MAPRPALDAAKRLAAAWLLLAAACVPGHTPAAAAAPARVLRVVYFTPADRAVAPDHRTRLQRVLEDVREFYAEEMEANGYGRMTFSLEYDDAGRLRVYEVQGRNPAAAYGRTAWATVADEVRQGLRAQGIAMDEETVVIFQRLLDWQDGRTVEIGPYAGSGGGGKGRAFVYDDAHLDADLLSSRDPAGYCSAPCTWGAFNGLYIGGIAHELGHAFGLPHLAETGEQRAAFGISLMAGGNSTYRRPLWGNGPTSFLAHGSAVMLLGNPLFAGGGNVEGRGDFQLSDLAFESVPDGMLVRGTVTGATPVFAVVGRNDDLAIANDYDAVGWTADVAADGRFELVVGELKPTRYRLFLTAAGEDGRFHTSSVEYQVDANGRIDTAALSVAALLQQADAAFAGRDAAALRDVLGAVSRLDTQDDEASAKVEHLLALLDETRPVALRNLGAEEAEADLSAVAFTRAETGYGPALRDQVRVEGSLTARIEVGQACFPLGLYAHAPALHEVPTEGAWRTLSAGYGLQDGHTGSVVFVVRGDGRELFRSDVVRDHRPRWTEVDITDVQALELVTEDAGDGRSGDWAVWLQPYLER